MPEAPFKSLADDFTRSTKACVSGGLTVDHALAKFSILMNHKAEQDEDRSALAQTLYCGTMDWLKAKCSPDIHLSDHTVNEASRFLTRLTARDCLPFLPRDASGRLADAGLALLLASEAARKDKNDYLSRPSLVKIAEQTLAFADTIKAAQALLPAPAETPVKKNDERLSL